MAEILGIAAPIATMVAAIMTAANLGAKVTGWGFILFTLGSLAWCAVALTSGQQNLLVTNGLLVLVNIVGVWRWLGRVAKHEQGARSAEAKSVDASAPTLFAVSSLVGRKVRRRSGGTFGEIVGVMAACEKGQIAYVVVGVGGIGGVGQRLIAVDWAKISIIGDEIQTSFGKHEEAIAPDIDPEDWPVVAA